MGGPHKGSGRVRGNNLFYQKVVILLNCHPMDEL
jgi:hypothetical protein